MSIYDTIRSRLGDAQAKALQQMLKDPEIASLISIRDPANADGHQVLARLADFIDDKLSEADLPEAMRLFYKAIAAKLKLRVIPLTEDLKRPKEEGLTEALTAFADTKDADEKSSEGKMVNVGVDTTRLRWLTGKIDLTRELLRAEMRFSMALTRNMVTWEVEGEKAMRGNYPLIRPVALSDPELNEALDPVETYLYGAAKEGAQTAKGNRTAEEKQAVAAQEKGMGAARAKARTEIAGELGAYADELRGLSTAPASGQPGTPAPVGPPLAPAGPTSPFKKKP